MYICVILLPLIASIFALNRYCGKYYGPILSVIIKKISAILGLTIFFEIGLANSPVELNLGEWVDNANLFISWNFLFDSLTVSKFIPILIISFLIQLYSLEYKGHDPYKSKFFSLLSLFTFTKLLMVSSDNLLIIFLGWELVGLVSYLLVNFWSTRIKANKASLSALFLNKIGDAAFIGVLVLSVAIFGDISLSTIFSKIYKINEEIILILAICFIIAASAKSALFGLHCWLPKAKEGPTPVSALLHSSTKVTAGCYLLMRISPILEFSNTSLKLIIWLGSLGALLGACAGLVEEDLKRIVAKSTKSQLGYKKVAIGCSLYSLSMFHLIMHAFFKSLLFLSSGAVLHALSDQQDIRKMGGLILQLPITSLVFLLGSLSLMAFPFTAGFYSKDLLLEILLSPLNFTHSLAYLFTILGAFFTSLYSIRTKMIVFLSRPSYSYSLLPYIKDSGWKMSLPLIILSISGIILGYFTNELFLAYGSIFYKNSLFTHPSPAGILLDPLALSSSFTLLPLLFIGLFFMLYIHSNDSIQNLPVNKILPPISLINFSDKIVKTNKLRSTLGLLAHFNIFNHWVMHYSLILSNFTYRYKDKGLLEIFGPNGKKKLLNYLGFSLESISTGYIAHYALLNLVALFSVFVLLTFLFS